MTSSAEGNIRISVAICTYERYGVLRKAIESASNQSIDRSQYEILVIDNSPNARANFNDSCPEAYDDVDNLNYVFEDIAGLSNARNVATARAQGDYIVFLDDDAIASSTWLEGVLAAFSAYPNAGIVGGRIDPIWEVPRPSWMADKMLGSVSVVDWGGACRVAAESEWFAGANIAFSVEGLKQVGGFSTNLGRVGNGASLMSNEEIAVVEALEAMGYQRIYAPEARVDHLVEEKRLTRTWYRKRTAWQATSDLIKNSSAEPYDVASGVKNVRAYIASQEPLERNVQALWRPTDDPGEFLWQLGAIYDHTMLMLLGFDGLEGQ